MVESKLKVSEKLNQVLIDEIESMTSEHQAMQSQLIDYYIDLYHQMKAKSIRVESERTGMENLVKDF